LARWSTGDNIGACELFPVNFADVYPLIRPVSNVLDPFSGVMRDGFGSVAVTLNEHKMAEPGAGEAESEAAAATEHLDASWPVFR
jgi:hypothetical protein